MTKKTQLFKPSSAEKAFVYQQTQDLAASLSGAAPVSVLLEKYSSERVQDNYAVTFILGVSPMSVQARSEGSDLMEVCVSAKNEMKKKMSLINQSMKDSPQRIKLIEELKKSPYTH